MDKYSLQEVKYLDSKSFCIVVGLIKSKSHLTIEGLNEIRLIKNRMNRNRVVS